MSSSDVTQRVVLCDASPLIFLAKADRLDLIAKATTRQIAVLECVVQEVVNDRASPVEAERLRRWLKGVEVVQYEGSLFDSGALSRSDQSSLAWAVEHRAECLLADERLLRRFAQEHGIKVIGVCGILMQATKRGHLSAQEALDCIDTAVGEHGFRISIELYRRIRAQLK